MEIEGVPGTEDEPEDSHFHDQYYDGVGDDESGHAAWRKLKYGPPENLSELEIMFEHTAVDGSTSCVAGEQMDDEVNIGEEGGDEADVTPLSVSNKKRSSNNTATVISPKKKIKSPMDLASCPALQQPLRKLLAGLVSSYRYSGDRVDADVAKPEAAQLSEAVRKKPPHHEEVPDPRLSEQAPALDRTRGVMCLGRGCPSTSTPCRRASTSYSGASSTGRRPTSAGTMSSAWCAPSTW
ncbi:hypothetical protein ZWY2020_020765 [Hordeum vulgare]|nr:hypothetical protein ZWY2020_020765 [Hordeum vulgare]